MPTEPESVEWDINENLPVYTRDLLWFADRRFLKAQNGDYTLGYFIRDMANDLGNRERDWSRPESNWGEEYNATHPGDASHQFALTPKERYEVKRIIREEIRSAYHQEFFGED